MVNTIKKASNKFTKGLIMDFSPENTQNEVLTHALNATLLTFNGNEMSLQNDMGNARVETAYLPEGYIPVGTCEYGGIIYIVSYNPLENKSQIGCFPSPERNISHDEQGESDATISREYFQQYENGQLTGKLNNITQYVLLKNDNLNPGDKFVICADEALQNERLKDLFVNIGGQREFELVPNPTIALHVVSIENSGKITYLNSDVLQYETKFNNNKYKYHLLCKMTDNNISSTEIDQYRNVLSSGYSVFKSKTSGKLAILAELITIDSYSVTHGLTPTKDSSGTDVLGSFDVIIHTDVTPVLDDYNYNTAPKLKYYFLEKSQGYLSYYDSKGKYQQYELYDKGNQNIINTAFFDIPLIDTDSKKGLFVTTQDNESIKDQLEAAGTLRERDFNFPKPQTYHGRMELCSDLENIPDNTFIEFKKDLLYAINRDELLSNIDQLKSYNQVQVFYKENDAFIQIDEIRDDISTFYVKCIKDTLIPYSYLNIDVNTYNQREDNKLYLYTLQDFIPNKSDYKYSDIKLATLQIPPVLFNNNIDLPFKYDYTIIPCMDFGKLDHLAISNTVDFSKLHQFNQSNFNIWKYRIDGNQLRLTFGSEIFDTFETDKVSGLLLEFYDLWGFSGSLEITDKKYYSGVFTKVLELNTLGTLNTTSHNYPNGYSKNINIYKKDTTFYLGENKVTYSADSTDSNIPGWKYVNTPTSFENDCGVLYSNVLYGVKAYIKQTDSSGVDVYTKKNEFFLYTLPILNNYFYTVDNFNNLENPELDFQLTYKLIDRGTSTVFNNYGISNGYCDIDAQTVSQYQSGMYNDETSFNAIKYYRYHGITDLYLEIGLVKDYTNFNLKYDPDINKCFTCTLKLMSDSDSSKTYSVNSGVDGLIQESQILNYTHKNGSLDTNINQLGFNEIQSQNITLGTEGSDGTNFYQTNFITNTGTPIPIHYNFVVGYTVNVSNIVNTQIQTTTVCALYHKNKDGEYNDSDFNIYKDKDSQEFLWNGVLYNEGAIYTSIFGICKQKATLGDSTSQLEDFYHTTTTVDSEDPGKLNSGNAYKEMLKYIGKLTFCQPHAHVYSGAYGANVYYQDTEKFLIPSGSVPYKWGGDWDDAGGTYPSLDLKHSPRYNMSVHTTQAVAYATKFISSMEWNVESGFTIFRDHTDNYNTGSLPVDNMREFIGFDGKQISTFATKLLKTMSCIYAYNPDYDQLEVQKGTVSIQNYTPSFISNLLSVDSEFIFPTGKCLNDYIYFGDMCFTNYLIFLQNYSDIKIFSDGEVINKHLKFTENKLYCGTSDSYFLLNTLTYNTPVPTDLENSLTYDLSQITTIKHSNGSITTVQGKPNKRKLYGYLTDETCLVELDVSNYTIENDGKLTIVKNNISNIQNNSIVTSDYTNNYFDVVDHKYVIKDKYKNACLKGCSLTLNDLVYDPTSDHRLTVRDDRFNYDVSVRGLITYRTANTNWESWEKYYPATSNSTYLYTGPCFTPNTL